MNQEILLARHGLKESDLTMPANAKENYAGKLLAKTMKLIANAGLAFDTIPERKFITLLEEAAKKVGGPGLEALIDPTEDEIPYTQIDTHLRGIIRWMNELGIYTLGSCSGHGKRPADIQLYSYIRASQLEKFKAAVPENMRLVARSKSIQLHYTDLADLLIMAENLHLITKSRENIVLFQANQFKHRLIELLEIPGASQSEHEIRRFLLGKLRRMTDYATRDRKGNLLATKFCGEGPTILLSAHMDTVEEIVKTRQILQNGTMLTSSEGILGADDRAGIAVILDVLANIHKTNFNGVLKITFTVEEEIGLRGASGIDQRFLDDIGAAIVIDRRGNRDIVTSFASVYPFCPDEYGKIFEDAGQLAGMPDWQTTPGGSSDAKVFAEFGIPSVNLSAGYVNEHTDEEYVDYLATYETYKLIETVLHKNLLASVNLPTVKGEIVFR